MSDAKNEPRLTQWMLDVGVPKNELFDLLVSSVGPARSAQIIKSLQRPGDATTYPPIARFRRVA